MKASASSLDLRCEVGIVWPAAAMDEQSDKEIASKKQRDQMLKLVAKGFYNELINYGVGKAEIVRVASHLLDNLLAQQKKPANDVGYYNELFKLACVIDEASLARRQVVCVQLIRPTHAPA